MCPPARSTPRRTAALGRLPATLLAPLLLIACACGGPDLDGGGGIATLEGSRPTLDALGEAALTALVRGDTGTLEALRLSEREHNEVIYPEFPAAAAFPVDMAWENVERRGRRDLARQLRRFRGREVRYRGAFCAGEPRAYATFEAGTDCWVVFDDAEHGRMRVKVFDHVVVRAGGYKLVRYYDHAPRRVALP